MTNKDRTDFAFVITTDGSRKLEFVRLISSTLNAPNAAYFILLQRDIVLDDETLKLLPKRTTILRDKKVIPLSVARNRLLVAMSEKEVAYGIDNHTVVLLADDDCWYSEDFFLSFPQLGEVGVFRAIDPSSGKRFSTLNLEKRRLSGSLSRWELMFYGVSISFWFRYSVVRGAFFNENIGLGNEICQGEESLFVLRMLASRSDVEVQSYPLLTVYHPWKTSANSNNHRSLGYFLGWTSVRGYSSVLPYFLFLWAKYSVAMIIKPRKLYFAIFVAIIAGFWQGLFDTKDLGCPNG
jgi:hypothetical protein